jgi:hypothetical protein
MNRNKCPQCGLVNAPADEACRRCAAALSPGSPVVVVSQEQPIKRRGFGQRLLWVAGTTLALLFAWYLSMLLTSSELDFDRRQTVAQAIAVLKQQGFSKQVFVLKHLVKYRDTDNWWNRSIGHHDAYAATNFPFEVVTLYPGFFDTAVDDTERAAILLHESYHLFGSGEAGALEGTWREKHQLGWTADRYGQTRVWNNTTESTTALVPRLFKCGADEHSDCVP